MSIFMISPKEEPVQEVVETPKNTEGSELVDTTEMTEVNTEEDLIPIKEINEKTIMLDGPLSQVYTQALNQMYAKESYITEMETLKHAFKDEDRKKALGDMASYIYVISGPFLENNEDGAVVEAFESMTLAAASMKKLFVCVEHNMNITPRVADFIEYSRDIGATIVRDRNTMLEMLSSSFKH